MSPASSSTSSLNATFVGMTAIPMWALLPALTVLAGEIPPLELVGITFSIGASAGAVALAFDPLSRRELARITAMPIVVGILGLFGFHFAYFLALQNAPAVEANLINYLWPVLIVLFSALLPGQGAAGRLTAWHLLGAFVAFGGAAYALTGGAPLAFAGNGFGYAMALVSALTWSSYSVVTRLFPAVPTSAVSLYCAGTAALAWFAHAILETTVWPSQLSQWAAIAGLGIGPVGLAFYVWDYGCKRGDLRVLGAAAYFAPVVSTAILIAARLAAPRPELWAAAALITGGALLAGKDLIFPKGKAIMNEPDASKADAA